MVSNASRALRILTWHVHGNYLHYLSHCPHEFFVPVDEARSSRFAGTPPGFPWRSNVHEIPTEQVPRLEFDCILFQNEQNYTTDQYDMLSEAQRRLPKIYLEHDPPRANPTDQRHIVEDPDVLIVHVTDFNRLMWDCGPAPVRVIEHGVAPLEEVRWSGEMRRGIVVVNNLSLRGRRLGADVFEQVRWQVPLDVAGVASESFGGLGDVPSTCLASLMSSYRFFFNPIRYTSLGLAVCEAMMLGMPIVGLATTELATVVENGVSGWIDTCVDRLVDTMRDLLDDPTKAKRWGEGARRRALARFNINRFAADWDDTFRLVTRTRATKEAAVPAGSIL